MSVRLVCERKGECVCVCVCVCVCCKRESNCPLFFSFSFYARVAAVRECAADIRCIYKRGV